MNHEERRLAESASNSIELLRQRAADLREYAQLLNAYGEAKFDDEWDPRAPEETLDSVRAERLLELTEKL